MPLKVLIVPDKFKGTLSAEAAARAVAAGWRRARPGDDVELLPMSDGGDGFGEAMSMLLGATRETVKTVDAAHRPMTAEWWWVAKQRVAIIESARVVGLAKLPPGKFHPFALDTFGLGAVMRAAAAKGAKRCLMGIGGSATNDGGFGVARSLGWEFLDAKGGEIEAWTRLHTLARIKAPGRTRWFDELVVAVDVQNPLLGAHGCTRIFGPQKGLVKCEFTAVERCLRRMALVVGQQRGRSDAIEPGAGAAGGLGFGLRAFAGARLEPGFELFARYAALGQRLHRADVVITGEGAIDRSTFMGKGVGEIAEWCRKRGKPCIGLAGHIVTVRQVKQLFAGAHALAELTTAANAERRPEQWLLRLAIQAAQNYDKNFGRKL